MLAQSAYMLFGCWLRSTVQSSLSAVFCLPSAVCRCTSDSVTWFAGFILSTIAMPFLFSLLPFSPLSTSPTARHGSRTFQLPGAAQLQLHEKGRKATTTRESSMGNSPNADTWRCRKTRHESYREYEKGQTTVQSCMLQGRHGYFSFKMSKYGSLTLLLNDASNPTNESETRLLAMS